MNDLIVDLENYRVINKIGEGSYGKVYLVQDIHTNKQLVAKESKVECQTTKDQKRFFNEITAFSKVHSPSVLSFIGFNLTNFEGDHYPIILTEYMPNGSLDKLLKRSADFPSSKKYIILLGIAKGMRCLHEHGIIHRDLKPANILLDENFYPRICDFGESVVSELTISSILMESYKGTPAYMAPEVFSDDSYTYKADIFSFSMIMYQILTDKEPFPKLKSVFRLQDEIEKGKRPDLTFIKDESIKIFLNKCWSTNPNERPDFKEIIEEIQKERYMKALSANKTEVSNYLKLFDSKAESKAIKNTKAVTKNNKDPQRWKIEADKGDPKAMFSYGRKLELGINGVSENKKEAIRYYKMAADKGHTGGMLNYSLILFHTTDPDNAETNQKEALHYCKMAADNGYHAAMFLYGSILSHGSYGVAADKESAANYYKMAADKGNVKAMNSFAIMLAKGHGIPQNIEEAIKYYQMAADKGNATAMLNLGIKLLHREKGDSIKNKEAAARYLRMAAEKGNVLGMERYAELLENGTGVAVDAEAAARYRKMADDAKQKKQKKP